MREKEIQEQRYAEADKLAADEDFESAIAIFEELGNYKDSSDRITATVQAEYEKAEQFYVENKLEESEQLFKNLIREKLSGFAKIPCICKSSNCTGK